MLNIQRDSYVGVFSSEVGAVMTIHEPNKTPYPEKFGSGVSPGSFY